MKRGLVRLLGLCAAAAILAPAFAGSAFAAEFAWKSAVREGDWGDGGNWVGEQVPNGPDAVAVFSSSGVRVHVRRSTAAETGMEVGRIRIDADASVDFVTFEGADLQLSAVGEPGAPAIEARGNAAVWGGGELALREGAHVAVYEGATVDVKAVASAGAEPLQKLEKGVLAFSGPRANRLGGGVTIVDGELQIGRADHIGDGARVAFDTGGVPGRAATLTTTWDDTQSWTLPNKLVASSDGTINVSVPGSAFRFAGSEESGEVIVQVYGEGLTVTKAGPGGILLASDYVWDGFRSVLKIAEGAVEAAAGDALGFLAADTTIGEGARLVVGVSADLSVGVLSGPGTLELREGSRLTIMDHSEFPGLITGAGSLAVFADVAITGETNDYTGHTFVWASGKLAIGHERNLGAAERGSLYLEPLMGNNADPALEKTDIEDYARLEIKAGFNGTLPSEIVIGGFRANGETWGRNEGEAAIIVPAGTRFEVTEGITFNQNALLKLGGGELVLSSIGRDCAGDGTFNVGQQTAKGADGHYEDDEYADVTTSLHIRDGLVRIEDERAADWGDIVVDAGGYPAERPILNIRGGLKMTNAIYFTDHAAFASELTDAGSPAEVGEVFFAPEFIPANTNWTGTGTVHNRAAFGELAGGLVGAGSEFTLLKAARYTNYDAPKVEPATPGGGAKAPFEPYFSGQSLYFRATHQVDIPVLGAAEQTAAGGAYRITVPVVSATGLLAGSAAVHNLPGVTGVRTEGSTVVIDGTAPALSADVTYRVFVTTAGDPAANTLGSENCREFTLSPNDSGGSDGGGSGSDGGGGCSTAPGALALLTAAGCALVSRGRLG